MGMLKAIPAHLYSQPLRKPGQERNRTDRKKAADGKDNQFRNIGAFCRQQREECSKTLPRYKVF